MAFVPGTKFDVFISYAHFDNEGGATGEKWVSDFVHRLEGALKQRLGCPIEMYFDTRSLEGHQNLSEILESVRGSAIFVPILSPSYVNRQWTKDELDAYNALDPASRVIFTIERLPLDGGPEEYPEPLRERKRTQFWFRTEDSGVVDILTPSIKQERYFGAITDVVDHMTRQLRQLKQARAAQAAAGPVAAAPSLVVTDPGIPPVLLAQVTEDLDEQRDQVRRHLEQFGLTVLPGGLYPQGGTDFSKAFEADLAKAGMFAQLLGPIAGRKPPDLQQGYAQYQFEAAKAKGVPSMLWRRPDLDPATVTGAHAALVGNPTVQAMSLQSFKAEIVRRMQKPPPPPPKPAVATGGGMVFINAVPGDIELASKLEEDFVNQGCTVVLPAMDGAAEDILKDLSENIIDCNALVLVYGSAENMWVRSQLKLYNKLKPKREAGECVVLICNAPPAPKAPIGMRLPEAHEIEYPHVLDSEPVVELLSKLRH